LQEIQYAQSPRADIDDQPGSAREKTEKERLGRYPCGKSSAGLDAALAGKVNVKRDASARKVATYFVGLSLRPAVWVIRIPPTAAYYHLHKLRVT